VIQLYGAGRLTEASAAAEQAVAIREKALGRSHQGFGEALNALAIVYNRQGRNADAELLFTRVVAIWEKTLGSTQPQCCARPQQSRGRL